MLNITPLILATAAMVSVSEPMPREAVCDTAEPIIGLWDGDEVMYMEVEEYLVGCVMSEIPYSFEAEAAKAQAVAARTYLYYCLDNGAKAHPSGDICTNSGHCMGYLSDEEYIGRYGDGAFRKAEALARSAVSQTEGIVLTYDGEYALTVWHSSSEGYTEACEAVWQGELPYLRSVSSPEEAAVTEVECSLAKVREILRGAGYTLAGGENAVVIRTKSGRCDKLKIGGVLLDGEQARRLFSLRSTDFDVELSEDALKFTVRGYGHGVGMSQYGAQTMASCGMGYSEILKHYYSGTELVSIKEEHDSG